MSLLVYSSKNLGCPTLRIIVMTSGWPFQYVIREMLLYNKIILYFYCKFCCFMGAIVICILEFL